MSEKKTKVVSCIACSVEIEVSLFMSPKKAMCNDCKSSGTKTPEVTKAAEQPEHIVPAELQEKRQDLVQLLDETDKSLQPNQHTVDAARYAAGLAPIPWKGASGQWVVPEGYTEPGPWNTQTLAMLTYDGEPGLFEEPQAAQNSMRANRESKLQEARPFVPNPYFLRQSMITSYLQCPDKMYDSYENGYSEETVFTKVGTTIHGILEDYYNGNHDVDALFAQWWQKHAVPDWDWYEEWRGLVKAYFDRHGNKPAPQIIATELEFQVVVNGVPMSGTIDRVDRIDAKTIAIRDYKSNMRPFSKDDLDNSIQFSVYDIVARQLKDKLGEFEHVQLTYDMLRLGYEQHTSRTDEQRALFADWLAMIWKKILSGEDRKPLLNQYCAFCQKRNDCPTYGAVLKGEYKPILTDETDMGKLDQERVQLGLMAKVIEKRQAEIDTMIKTAIQESGGVVDAGDAEYKLVSQPSYSYPTEQVIKALAMGGLGHRIPEVVTIGSTKLKDILKGNKDLADRIEAMKVQGWKSPSLTRVKKKGVDTSGDE